MSENQQQKPDAAEIDDLIASLNAEFGKKPKLRTKGPTKKVDAYTAAAQLARAKFSNYADFAQWKFQVESIEIAKSMDWRPAWTAEAKLTYVVKQHCKNCGNTVSFIGGEYLRFRSRREHATIVRRAEVCPDLFHFNYGDEPLPDLVDEIYQTVPRCPGCIKVEAIALELWYSATNANPEPQKELPGIPEKPRIPLSGERLKALIQKPFGERAAKPSSDELQIDFT